MGLRNDRERFREVGEARREDLSDFVRYGDLSPSDQDRVKIPIKIVELPEFRYDERDLGGIGEGEADVGDPIDIVDQGESGEDGTPGSGRGEHNYYEMDPAEFAAELDEALGLDLEPKGKKVIERIEGAFTDRSRAGPESMLDVRHLFVQGLKRKLAMDFDEEFMGEVLRVEGIDPDAAYTWARDQGIPVARAWLVEIYGELDSAERERWGSLEELLDEQEPVSVGQRLTRDGLGQIPLRQDDERYRHPEVIEEYQRNVVVVNIRDVSGSMRETKRDLVERTFSPLDWYLQGKYDHAEFIYIVHDSEAWEVERRDFFGIESGGGTRISAAYELAADRLEAYPWTDWNRFVFAAGDSENATRDTRERVIPLMEQIDANLHAYVETTPGADGKQGRHARELETHFVDQDDVVVSGVHGQHDVMAAIHDILRPEAVAVEGSA